MKRLWGLLCAVALLFASPALADSAGSAIGGSAGSQSDLAGCIYLSSPSTMSNGQQTGLRCNSTGGVQVSATAAGSTGTDRSANKPTLPNVGADFAAAGPYASYFLVKTIAANESRALVDIENISGAQIAVVRDDGTAAAAAAPVNASVFALGGGSGEGQQGGSWSSTTFRGRLQIYAPASTAIVTAWED